MCHLDCSDCQKLPLPTVKDIRRRRKEIVQEAVDTRTQQGHRRSAKPTLLRRSVLLTCTLKLSTRSSKKLLERREKHARDVSLP